MKKTIIFLLFIGMLSSYAMGQEAESRSVYLITVDPGDQIYSIYGHSALRIIDHRQGTDKFYNWGVFDFDTPKFAWKFAKGRLDYLLDVNSENSFLGEYIFEKRTVRQQKINLETPEIDKLEQLLAENLKPENIKYRYDFFYDDCSTRIRDLIEKAVGTKLIYPPAEKVYQPTFREEVGKYQRPYPWKQFGINLIMGRPGERKTDLRSRMFLPLEMMDGLSQAVVNRDGKLLPLLSNQTLLLEFDPPSGKSNFFISPVFLFSLLLILVIIQLAYFRGRKLNRWIDIALFTIFSCLAVLMVFFNFFTDHEQMRWNLNIIWLSPFVIVCLASLIIGRKWEIWFKTVFYLSSIAFLIQVFLPRGYVAAFIPLILILMIRSASRAGFRWNPFALESF